MAKTGRKTKLTAKLQDEICGHLASGCYAVTACELAGISESTFYNWLERGRDGEDPFLEFLESVKKAEAQAEVKALTIIQNAMADDWKAAMTWLERKFPDRWARRKPLDVAEAEPEQEEGKPTGPSAEARERGMRALMERVLAGKRMEEKAGEHDQPNP
ncbi:MAG: hypothetical protein R6V19_15035 [Armatimonadota bacterium]